MVAALTLSVSAMAQTKWDLPARLPATNFHTENLMQFANDVDKATGGKLKITVHPNASLFKAPEIKRAVQGGQAQIGEILLVNFQNEWQIFGADGMPFLADSYDSAMKLYKAQKPLLEKKLAEQGMMLLYAVAWPPQGIYSKKPLNSAADMKGLKWRAYSPATARIAELVGAQPVTVQAGRAVAGDGHRRRRLLHDVGLDRLRHARPTNTSSTGTTRRPGCPRTPCIVNQAAFDALDKPTQDALLKAAADAETRGWAASQGGEHAHPEPAEAKRHEHRDAVGAAQGRHEEGRRHHAEGVAREGRSRGPGDGGRLPQVSARRQGRRRIPQRPVGPAGFFACEEHWISSTTPRPGWPRCP